MLDLTKILYYLNDLTLNQAAFASAGNPFMVDNLVVVCDGAEFCMRWPVESDPSNIATEYEIRLGASC